MPPMAALVALGCLSSLGPLAALVLDALCHGMPFAPHQAVGIDFSAEHEEALATRSLLRKQGEG